MCSTVAEYVAVDDGLDQIIYIQRFYKELEIPYNIPTILCDNKTTIKVAENPYDTKKSRSTQTKQQKIKQFIQAGWVTLRWIPGYKNLADLNCTKPLAPIPFQKNKEIIHQPTPALLLDLLPSSQVTLSCLDKR